MRKLQIVVILLLTSVFFLFAQEKSYLFDHLSAQDGLSHSSVNCILQDRQGFLWIGTQNGLNKYDGNGFKIYKSYDQNTNGLTNNCIKALYEDKHGNLWIGTAGGGLLKLNKELDVFENFTYNANDVTSISSNDVYSICEDSENNIWVGTYGGGLNKFNPTKKTFLRYAHSSMVKTSLNNNNIRALHFDKNGDLWIGTDGGGLDLLKNKSQAFIHFTHNSTTNSISDNGIMTIAEDKANKLWIGTYGGGINIFDKATQKFERINSKEGKIKLSNDIVWNLYFENDSMLWVSTRGGGVNVINIKTWTISYIHHIQDDYKSLNSNIVVCVYKDKTGIYWIGTEDKGLNKINMQKQNFKSLSDNKEINKIINNSKIAAFFEDEKQNLWIGTYDKGLYYYDTKEMVLKIYSKASTPALSGNTVLSITKDNNNRLWLGTDGEGVDVFDLKTLKITNYRNNVSDKSLSNNAVHCLLKDHEGSIWLGTWGGGLNKFNPTDNTFTHYVISADPQKNVATCLFEDSNNQLWIGTYGSGLALLNKKMGKFSCFMENNAIFCIAQNNDKRYLWIGTQGNGLVKMQLATKLSEGITEKNGLSNDVINGMAFDLNNNLWITTINGLSFYSVKENRIRKFDVNDGLLSNDFTPKACLLTKSGNILAGSPDGVNKFNPDDIISSHVSPEIIITNFYVFNQEVKTGTIVRGTSILSRDISQTTTIVLPYNLNVISFDFIGVDLASPQKIIYAYMLEGLDKDWSLTDSKRRTITYAQIPPGTYILKIKSTNSDGEWAQNIKELKITVTPPFWKTIWFYILVVIGTIALIFYYVRFKTKQIIRDKEILEAKIKERTLELELRNEEIVRQTEKIIFQNEKITDQNEILAKQQAELEIHKNHLEQMVNQRTRELKLALRKADESDSLKTAFLTNISHEVRTPMNAIIGFADLLGFPEITLENRRKYISLIKSNGDMLVKMIDNIIDLSKIETGQITISKSECVVNKIIDDLKPKYEKLIELEGKNIVFKTEVDPKVKGVIVNTDKDRLIQILDNLLDNALKYTVKGEILFGVSLLNSRPRHPELEFFVKDTGIGIDKDRYDAIFGNFIKLESKEQSVQGAGLGLSLSKSLIGILGGRMWVESEEGFGSVFHCTIPFETGVKAGVINTSNWRDKKILIVDDQEINHVLFNEILKPFGLNLIYAKNGTQAIEMTKQSNPDLILMDLRMPDISGYEAVERIRSFNTTIPIIAQSAFIIINERERILKSGFNDVLSKPIDSQLLLKIIDNFFSPVSENK